MKKLITFILSFAMLVQSLSAMATGISVYHNLSESSSKTAPNGSSAFYNLYFPESVRAYQKLEITFDINISYTNPFDPQEILVDGVFTYPDGSISRIPAFYRQGFKSKDPNTTLMTYNPNMYVTDGTDGWCVRFSGAQEGLHSFHITATDSTGYVYTSEEYTFTVSPGDSKGYVTVSPYNPEYFINSADGSLFYGSGSNLAWVREPFTSEPTHLSYEYFLGKMKENGCTLTRIWLCHWAWLEWTPEANDPTTSGYSGVGYYNQYISSALDHIFELCEDYGIRLILTLDDNNEHITDTDSYDSWKYNPYNAENGGPVETPEDYYSNTQVRKLYKNRLRYIIARWGYSDSLMSLNLWNDETNPTDSVIDYLDELNSYTKELTANFRPLLFGSNYKYSANSVLDYSTQSTSDGTKPSLTQECYYTDNTAYFKNTLRRTLWKDFFSKGASAMVWSHDTVDETDSWDIFTSLTRFAQKIPLHLYKYNDSYSIKSFVDSWDVGGVTPEFTVKNGKLAFKNTKAGITSFADIKLTVTTLPKNAVGLAFDYDMHENKTDAIFRISLNSDSGSAYMPWYGKAYSFTDNSGTENSLTVSGSNQWSSWLSISAETSGSFTIPLNSLHCPESELKNNDVEDKYKNNIFSDTGCFSFIIQQQSVSHDGVTAYVDNIRWILEDGSSVCAQDFTSYKAENALSAEYTDSGTDSWRVIKARPLGDVAWGEKANENNFYINENDNDMLLEGISGLLYGTNSDRVILKNDPTFIIEANTGGEMIIELSEIGSGTNTLSISRDGIMLSETEFSGGRRELNNEERYITVSLIPGINRITLSNSGHDWISVSGYYFKFISSNPKDSVYIKRLINENQQLALIMNTKSGEVYESIAGQTCQSAFNVQIPFYELSDGDYRLEISDTADGKIIKKENLTVIGGQLTVTVDKLDDMLAVKLTRIRPFGDANSDGYIDIRDLVRYKRYLADDRITINTELADVNLDKAITLSDLVLIRKYLIDENSIILGY